MAYPFYESLRQSYPQAEITFLCGENLKSFPDSGLCQKKIVLDKAAKRVGPEFFSLVHQLRKENFNMAIALTASISSSLLLGAAKIPVRIGFSQSGSGLFLTDSLKWKGIDAGKHKTNLYLELLEFMTGRPCPRKIEGEAHRSIQKKIVVAPGASISLRVWPYYFELIRSLALSYPDYEIAVVGARQESHWHELIQKINLKNLSDFVEKTPLSELIDLCRESQLIIANDSGTAHLAGSIAKVPTLVLFGPGSPDYIKPIGPEVYCEIPRNISCHPCEKAECHEKYGYQICLKSISLEAVLERIKEVLALRHSLPS